MGLIVQTRIFLSFSHNKTMGTNDPMDMANLDPRSMVGRINVGEHLTSLHTLSISTQPHGFREEDF